MIAQCPRCGKEVFEGDEFCAACGAPVSQLTQAMQQPVAQPPPTQAAGPPPGMAGPQPGAPQKKPGGFLSTPGGIVLIIASALVIIAVVVVVAVVATRNSGSDTTTSTKDSSAVKSTSPESSSTSSITEQVADAEKVIDEMLPYYEQAGYSGVADYMTDDYYKQYTNANPPWDQVSYTITSTTIKDKEALGPDQVVFTIEEELDDMGIILTRTTEFSMVKEGLTWKLDNIEEVVPPLEGGASSRGDAAYDEETCMMAMQAYMDSYAGDPIEPLQYTSFSWDNPQRTSATAMATMIGGDGTRTPITLSATRGSSGNWIVVIK